MGSPEGAGCGRSKRGPKYAKRILGLNQCAAWVQCSQGAPRRGGVWRIEAGPEIREADFGIEPMRSIDPMPSMRAAGIVHVAQVEQVGDADQGAAQGHHRGVDRKSTRLNSSP